MNTLRGVVKGYELVTAAVGAKQRRFVQKSDVAWLKSRIERLGPTYVKIAQIVSSRKDLIPRDVGKALSQLHDDVTPMSPESLRAVLAQYPEFLDAVDVDMVPIASASIAQVHRGVLRATGEDVAVKVKRLGIERDLRDDVALLQALAGAAGAFARNVNASSMAALLSEARETMLKEADFDNEVRNMALFYKAYRDSPEVRVPRVHEQHCTPDVIVMEYMPAVKVEDHVAGMSVAQREDLSYRILNAFMDQIMRAGVVHGDPHLGNMGVCPKDGRMVLFDYGNVVAVDARMQADMRHVFFELLHNNMDEAIAVLSDMRDIHLTSDREAIVRYLRLYMGYFRTLDISVFNIDANEEIPIKVRGNMFRVLKTLGTIEGTCKWINPDFTYANPRVLTGSVVRMMTDGLAEYKARADVRTLLRAVDRWVGHS